MGRRSTVPAILKDAHDAKNHVFRVEQLGGDLRQRWTADEVQATDSLYRKRIDFGALANDDPKAVAHGIGDLDVAEGALLLIEGTVSDGTEVTPVELTGDIDAVSVDASDATIETGDDLTGSDAVVYLQYGKD